ncbi:hypothetical protein MIND_00188800 [Mycena indigotica]|uniref:Uncharacterized protein n=1 Tax=Mycena indigotica TaxID=2126181 RepID=A0A8H6T659_9AGAR|nr:uncharacterized protein MIND_00188800 [Mycena indigotica]KAF7311783.1 hypothetical protein MIND_00188800 [Mycena indigotica]
MPISLGTPINDPGDLLGAIVWCEQSQQNLWPFLVVWMEFFNDHTVLLSLARLKPAASDTFPWSHISNQPSMIWRHRDVSIWIDKPLVVQVVYGDAKRMHVDSDPSFSTPDVRWYNLNAYWCRTRTRREQYLPFYTTPSMSSPMYHNNTMNHMSPLQRSILSISTRHGALPHFNIGTYWQQRDDPTNSQPQSSPGPLQISTTAAGFEVQMSYAHDKSSVAIATDHPVAITKARQHQHGRHSTVTSYTNSTGSSIDPRIMRVYRHPNIAGVLWDADVGLISLAPGTHPPRIVITQYP